MVRLFCCVFASVLLLAGAVLADAQKRAKAAKIEAAWQGWLAVSGAKTGSLTIAKNGQIVREGDGEVWAMASLSKAITGACVMEMARRGTLDLSANLGLIFAEGKWGLRPGGRVASITIAQLLRQSSGLRTDRTQSLMFGWYGGPARHNDITEVVLQSDKRKMKTERFTYNNENYGVLGSVIEEVSGEPYGEVCDWAVLRPAGVRSATLNTDMGAYSSMGGWAMTTDDYTRFVWKNFGAASVLGLDPKSAPHIEAWGAFYGAGVMFRPYHTGHNFWHFGALCLQGKPDVGTYFALFDNGWSVVAAVDKCLDNAQMGALDFALSRPAVQ